MKTNNVLLTILLSIIGLAIVIFIFKYQPPNPPISDPSFVPAQEVYIRDSINTILKDQNADLIKELNRKDSMILIYKKNIKIIQDKYHKQTEWLATLSSHEQIRIFDSIYSYGQLYTDSAIVAVNNCYNANQTKFDYNKCIEILDWNDSINYILEFQIDQLKRIHQNDIIIIQNDSLNLLEYRVLLDSCNNGYSALSSKFESMKRQRNYSLIGNLIQLILLILK